MTFNEFKSIIEEKFPEVTPQQMEQFQLLNQRQHGGMENALSDFISYAKSSMRKKYNAL